MEKLQGYRRLLFLGMVLIALGITFTTTLKDSVGPIGIVFVAVGGFFFIVGMSKKRKEDEQKNK
jgi:ABC-type Fe3+-siderophore transport system permease subunit